MISFMWNLLEDFASLLCVDFYCLCLSASLLLFVLFVGSHLWDFLFGYIGWYLHVLR